MSIKSIDEMDRSELLEEIGRLILTDGAYVTGEWRALALVSTIQPGVQSRDVFLYPDDGSGAHSELPQANGSAIYDACERLRDVMSAETGTAWHQMLYQIWMPGPDFAATFEYDRPDRWSLGGYSAEGVASFAEQVDPARGRPGG